MSTAARVLAAVAFAAAVAASVVACAGLVAWPVLPALPPPAPDPRPLQPLPPAAADPAGLKPGSRGVVARLVTPDGDPAWLAADGPAFDRAETLLGAGDAVGFGQLTAAGRVFTVESGTEVLVIDAGVFRSEVRVRAGTYAGRSGLTHAAWVRPVD